MHCIPQPILYEVVQIISELNNLSVAICQSTRSSQVVNICVDKPNAAKAETGHMAIIQPNHNKKINP